MSRSNTIITALTLQLGVFMSFGASAQTSTLPDCRQPNLPVGSECIYNGSTLPVQINLGNITFSPPPQAARITEPLGKSAIAPSVTGHKPVTIGGLYTSQTEEGFSHSHLVSDGFKVFADYGLTRHLSIETRGTVIRYSVAEIGHYAGQNHTESVTAGPRYAFAAGRFVPYATAQFGMVHQQWYGLNLGAAAGFDLRLSKRLYWNVIDLEFRDDAFSATHRNPDKERQELGTGLAYRFGR